MKQMIRHLKHHEIDKPQWDACIEQAPNGLIYALSWYLDSVSPGWEALVYGEYEAVMPLCRRKKFGIHYLFQPFFTQQLGVFGKELVSANDFIEAIPIRYKHIHMCLNQSNQIDKPARLRKNYVLNISQKSLTVQAGFSRNCNRNIKKALSHHLQVEQLTDVSSFVRYIKTQMRSEIESIRTNDYCRLEILLREGMKKDFAEIIQVKDKNGTTLALGSFLKWRERIIFHVCASTTEGKSKQAMYLLVNHQIKKYSEKYCYFDFSGSDMEGVAYFNAGFGAQAYLYPIIWINKLPLLVRWLKK